jgi:hypothetical protein
MLQIIALLLLVAVCLLHAGATPSPRLPVNAHCPHHGYPYSDRAYAEYVANHPLTQPGVSERMAKDDPLWLSKQLTEFAFTTGKFAADYLRKIQPLQNIKRPFEFKLDCAQAKYAGILNGKPRDKPAVVVWGSRFNFETPLLLYRLHTYKDLVDFFFISETMRADHSHTPKPLLFERVKQHLVEFLPQIVHHVVDDTTYGQPFAWSQTTVAANKDVWSHEGHHFGSITSAFLKAFSKLADDSIVLHGDIGAHLCARQLC